MNLHERLKYARSRAGLSGLQVKQRTRIGESSLSEFEKGKRQPSLAQLHRLADVYRRSLSFFLEEGPIPTEVVLWREEPEAEASDIEAHFLRLCEQYHNLEVWTGERSRVSLPKTAGDAADYSYREAEALAQDVRNQLSLGDRPGLALLPVLEEVRGIKIFHLDFEPTGTAASTLSDTFGEGVLLNKGNVRWRRNFDLAHELFHLQTWSIFRRHPQVSTTSSCESPAEDKLATCFARNLLMPPEAVRTAIGRGTKHDALTFKEVFDVARQFDVSVEALLWHMHFLHMLRDDADDTKRLIKHAHELSPLLEERTPNDPPTYPERYRALAVKALMCGEISIGRFAEYLDITRQEAMKYVEQEVTDDQEVPLAPA